MKKSRSRLAQKKRDRSVVSTTGVNGAELEVRRIIRLETLKMLKSSRTRIQLVMISTEAERLAEKAVRDVMEETPPAASAACREGCDWCCHLTVGTAAPEVFRIATYLRETLSPDELLAL